MATETLTVTTTAVTKAGERVVFPYTSGQPAGTYSASGAVLKAGGTTLSIGFGVSFERDGVVVTPAASCEIPAGTLTLTVTNSASEPVDVVTIGSVSRGVGDWIGDTSKIQALKRVALASRFFNPRTRGVMATPPVVTAYDTIPAGMTNDFKWPVKPNVFRYFGGGAFTYAAYARRFPVTTYGVTGNVDNTRTATSWRAEAMIDAIKPVFRVTALAAVKFRFLVDGQYVDLTGVATPQTTGEDYIELDFTAAGGRKLRHIVIEGEQGAGFAGVSVGTTETVSLTSGQDLLRGIVIGDSFTEGVVATRYNDGWARVMGDYLGIRDLWASGSGGTGYLKKGASNDRFNARERLSDLTANSPDVAFIAMGLNDVGAATPAQVQTEAQTYYAAIRAACPNLPVFVFGAWSGSTGPSANLTSMENAISAAVSAMNDPLLQFIPVSTDANGSWISGTGRVGATTGTGNSDVYTSDGTHPNDAGHAYLGLRAADAVMSKLSALA